MNRYLLGSILGGLALIAAFGSGVVDWAAGMAGGNTSGVRVAQQSTSTSGADSANGANGAEPLERAGQLVQRQSAPTSATGQNVTAANQSVSNPANSSIAQGQPNQTTGTGGTTGGTATGSPATGNASTPGGAATTAPVGGTQPPANLESIPALW